MYRRIITLLLLCCLILPAQADEVKLQPNYPERYVVVKGDTLWGIAGRFLKDPWQWPQVWKMNQDQIKNPHWIYPGDVVVLDNSSGSPELRLLKQTVANPTVTVQPDIRTEKLNAEAIPTIAPNIIAPFLSQPLIIESTALKQAPTVISGTENRVILSPGSRVYVDKIPEGEATLWNIYRPGKTYVDPETKAILGTEAIYLGDARITKYGEPASGEIVRARKKSLPMTSWWQPQKPCKPTLSHARLAVRLKAESYLFMAGWQKRAVIPSSLSVAVKPLAWSKAMCWRSTAMAV